MRERGLRWAVEAKRKGRETQTELTEGQEQHEKARFREEEQSDVMSTDEQNAMSAPEEARTGRGCAGFAPGVMRSRELNETKGKGKWNGGKGEHASKGGEFGSKGLQQSVKGMKGEAEEDERGRVAPDMEAGWLTPPGHVGSRKERKGKERGTSAEIGQNVTGVPRGVGQRGPRGRRRERGTGSKKRKAAAAEAATTAARRHRDRVPA